MFFFFNMFELFYNFDICSACSDFFPTDSFSIPFLCVVCLFLLTFSSSGLFLTCFFPTFFDFSI